MHGDVGCSLRRPHPPQFERRTDVGWLERLVRRSSESEGGSDTHPSQPNCQRWVSLALNPSYKLSLVGA
jgi:hypothetical protein